MLDAARDIIATQPILATFLAIGLGYLVGQISLGGFSLGADRVGRLAAMVVVSREENAWTQKPPR